MTKLKLGPLVDEKPVRLTVELPAKVHRDLTAYAEALGRETEVEGAVEPGKLVAPMLARFMATDRAFIRGRRRPEPKEDTRSLDISTSPVAAAKLDERG